MKSLEQRLEKMEAIFEYPTLSQKDTIMAVDPPTDTGEVPNGSAADCDAVIDAVTLNSPFVSITTNIEQYVEQADRETFDAQKGSRKNPSNNDIMPALSDSLSKFPGIHLPDSRVKELRRTIFDGQSQRRLFISLPPKAEILLLFETFLDEFSMSLPLFHRQSLMATCQHHFPEDRHSAESGWWACLNTIIALTTQSKAVNSAFRQVSEFSWSLFKNAFSVFEELVASEPSILNVQAILMMAAFMSRSTDSKTTAFITCTAVRMMHVIGLHGEDPQDRLSPIEAEQRRRIFWTAYLLDKSSSVYPQLPPLVDNEQFCPNLPSECPPDGLGNVQASTPAATVNIFRLRIELAIIEAQAQKQLFSSAFVEV